MKTQGGAKNEANNSVQAKTEEKPAEKIDFSKVEIEPLFKDDVDFETFSKSDFRAVKVKECTAVPKSKKLLQFTLDDGTGEDRTILSGIHEYYEPEELVGKTCIAITNLPPRKMMGIDSCGMLISAVHNEEIHIFGEENTRATAVFLIKYLRTLGFSATNDIFAKNAWYFRNALAPANYTNLQKGIHETTEYLEVFLRNLLRLYIRRTGSNSKCISSDNYTSAVKKELQQLSTFSQIKEIRDKELNSVILSHLEMSEDLVEGIKSEWEQKKIFKKQIKGDDGTTLIEDSYCTRSYVSLSYIVASLSEKSCPEFSIVVIAN